MPLRILVVEDHEPFRRFLCTELQQRIECHTIEATEGPEAVEKAEALSPDLTLLDISLPGLHGLDVARRIRGLAPAARVLFVSHEWSPDVIHEALSLGARGYMHKLCVDADLTPALEAVLAGRRFVSSVLDANHHLCHEVQLYSDDSVLVEAFARFTAASLTIGQAAIVLATEAHREALALSLKAKVETIMVGGAPDRHRFFDACRGLIDSAGKATNASRPRVAICGECVGLLCAGGNLSAALSLEKAGNELVTTSDVDILCGYPWAGWEDGERSFSRVCAEHTAVRYQ
jgi:CheY-like chemotaxis protein